MIAALIGRFVQHCILAEARRKTRKARGRCVAVWRVDRAHMTQSQITAFVHGRRAADMAFTPMEGQRHEPR